MNIRGIGIPNNAPCKIKNWPYGPDISVVARLFVYNNGGYARIIPITEISSGIEEEILTEEFFVRFPKTETDPEDGVFAEISSGKFKGALIFLRFKNGESL